MPFATTQTVYIIDALSYDISKPLTVRCQSKDDDLGNKTFNARYKVLHPNEEFSFSFRRKVLIGSTLYFCHFWWENKDKSFEVFNNHIAEKDCGNVNGDLDECYWRVQADGFYFGAHRYPPPPYWMKES
uniref:S-protein homolog n=1 Tax=Nicotiana sylvestris TaxID=4096 RepID=A0A1U7VD36_NICSY